MTPGTYITAALAILVLMLGAIRIRRIRGFHSEAIGHLRAFIDTFEEYIDNGAQSRTYYNAMMEACGPASVAMGNPEYVTMLGTRVRSSAPLIPNAITETTNFIRIGLTDQASSTIQLILDAAHTARSKHSASYDMASRSIWSPLSWLHAGLAVVGEILFSILHAIGLKRSSGVGPGSRLLAFVVIVTPWILSGLSDFDSMQKNLIRLQNYVLSSTG